MIRDGVVNIYGTRKGMGLINQAIKSGVVWLNYMKIYVYTHRLRSV